MSNDDLLAACRVAATSAFRGWFTALDVQASLGTTTSFVSRLEQAARQGTLRKGTAVDQMSLFTNAAVYRIPEPKCSS